MKKFALALAFSVCGVLWPAMNSYVSAGANDKPVLVPAVHRVTTTMVPCLDGKPGDTRKLCQLKFTEDMPAHPEFATLAKAATAGTASACGNWKVAKYIANETMYGVFGNPLAWSSLTSWTQYNGCSTNAENTNVDYWSCCSWSSVAYYKGQYHKCCSGVLNSWDHQYFNGTICSPWGCYTLAQVELWISTDVTIYGRGSGSAGWTCLSGSCP